MKKRIIGTLMLSTILLGSVNIVNAAGEPDSKGTTNGTIGFKENDEPTGPVDPTDPTKPIDPDPINPPTGIDGPLSLDVVPALFDFGDSNLLSMKEETYYSKITSPGSTEGEPSITPKHVLQVTDNRDDLNGWSVKVSRTEFVNATDPTAKLAGSTLKIPAGEGRNALADNPQAIDPNITSTGAMAIPVDESEEGTGAVTVISVANQEGVGKSTSAYSWESKEESLTVPKNTAKKGAYSSTITWTLVADPVA